MKNITRIIKMTACALICGTITIHAAEVSTSLDIANAYVFRGYTLSDSVVLQPGLEVATPVTFGVWGNLNTDDYGSDTSGQFTEIDLYASYNVPLGLDPFGLSVGYTEYTYPSTGGGGDADREVAVGLSADILFSPSLDIYYGLDGVVEKTLYIELGGGHTIDIIEDITCDLGLIVAYINPDEGESGFSHANISAALGYKMFSLSVTYIAQLDDKVLPDATFDESGNVETLGYDTDIIVTLGISGTF